MKKFPWEDPNKWHDREEAEMWEERRDQVPVEQAYVQVAASREVRLTYCSWYNIMKGIIGRSALPEELVQSLMRMTYVASLMETSVDTELPDLMYFAGYSSVLSTRLASVYAAEMVASQRDHYLLLGGSDGLLRSDQTEDLLVTQNSRLARATRGEGSTSTSSSYCLVVYAQEQDQDGKYFYAPTADTSRTDGSSSAVTRISLAGQPNTWVNLPRLSSLEVGWNSSCEHLVSHNFINKKQDSLASVRRPRSDLMRAFYEGLMIPTQRRYEDKSSAPLVMFSPEELKDLPRVGSQDKGVVQHETSGHGERVTQRSHVVDVRLTEDDENKEQALKYMLRSVLDEEDLRDKDPSEFRSCFMTSRQGVPSEVKRHLAVLRG